MARTRSTKPAPAAKTESSNASSTTKYTLPEESSNAPKLFILPSKATKEARIVSLPNPRYSKPTRYLLCPDTGIYEFTKIAAQKTTPRSWMIETPAGNVEGLQLEAQVTNGADLFVATPVDPLFLLVPGLFGPTNAKTPETKRLFLCSDDHFDALSTSSSHMSEALRCPKTRALLESRMESISDTVDAGDEKMYRLSEKKLVLQILSKARSMSSNGLPASMEEKFVKKALEAPIQVQKSQAVTVAVEQAPETTTDESNTPTPKNLSGESQSSVSTEDSTATAVSNASTAATSVEDGVIEETVVSAIHASDEVTSLQRLRVAFSFICSSYIATGMTSNLKELLADKETSSVDFSPLDDYLAQLTKLRAEAASSRSMADYSRKRMLDEEEEEARAEKKRKVEEEKKKKATQSRGVKALEKVNTRGMKKMSDFFKKK
ncbi:ribonuclease H2 subunit B [Colletotrichum tofieldiae]|uniref:Ribonuclease H2 subunit B n=1 Tax=Colletotrichum tofieldiae TaxID=708197 RepID=A0A166UEL8_9PEZI|nr:ribonuclease H2 subunit B [Colletotrichum tofieldiae]GKT94230.1 ribonuclease H2 subunit B [Colletotrichum tofieldiae]